MGIEGLLGGLIGAAKAKPRTSPIIGFRNTAAIAVGESWLLDFETEPTSAGWHPFNRVKVVDNSTTEILEVRPNDSSRNMFTVLNRASEIYEGKTDRVRLINRGTAAIAIDEVIINAWTE